MKQVDFDVRLEIHPVSVYSRMYILNDTDH